MSELERKAAQYRDKVMKTWSPPLTGRGDDAAIVQTAVMQTLAYLFGPEFIECETVEQQRAIDQGMKVFEECFGRDE